MSLTFLKPFIGFLFPSGLNPNSFSYFRTEIKLLKTASQKDIFTKFASSKYQNIYCISWETLPCPVSYIKCYSNYSLTQLFIHNTILVEIDIME